LHGWNLKKRRFGSKQSRSGVPTAYGHKSFGRLCIQYTTRAFSPGCFTKLFNAKTWLQAAAEQEKKIHPFSENVRATKVFAPLLCSLS